ncbi:MAG: ribosome maturation factor RimM [Pseudomonadales bacterium]
MSDSAPTTPTGSCGTVVVVGRVLAPYGVRGWVHVAAFTQPVENLAEYRPWLLAREDGTDWRPVTVRELRAHGQGLVVSLAGVEDRTAAERLRGLLIGVPEAALPEPAADEYYWRDLIGALVTDQEGRELGRVHSLMETGAHDVLVVRRTDGTEVLIPFHDRYVLEVADGAIRVDWPEEAL